MRRTALKHSRRVHGACCHDAATDVVGCNGYRGFTQVADGLTKVDSWSSAWWRSRTYAPMRTDSCFHSGLPHDSPRQDPELPN